MTIEISPARPNDTIHVEGFGEGTFFSLPQGEYRVWVVGVDQSQVIKSLPEKQGGFYGKKKPEKYLEAGAKAILSGMVLKAR